MNWKQRIPRSYTHPEITMFNLLKQANIRALSQHYIPITFEGMGPRNYIVDFFLPDYNIVIEVDGKFHEKYTREKKDGMKDDALKSSGYRVMRFADSELTSLEKRQAVINKINEEILNMIEVDKK